MKIKTLFSVFLLILLFLTSVKADNVTLNWDPENDSRITGFECYYGTVSKTYTGMVSVSGGTITQCSITGIPEGVTYYYAAKAVDQTDNIKSDFSGEASYIVPCKNSISPTSASYTYKGGTGSITITAQDACAWSVTTPVSWTTITSSTSGIGNGTVNYSVSSNPGGARTQSFTIASQIFTITQSASTAKYVITSSAGIGGSISPSGRISEPAGSSKTFTISPNKNYSISSITVDGTSLGDVSSYTFTNVSANHTIKATFVRKK